MQYGEFIAQNRSHKSSRTQSVNFWVATAAPTCTALRRRFKLVVHDCKILKIKQKKATHRSGSP